MKIQLLSTALLCGMLSAQNVAKGYVFEDKTITELKTIMKPEFPISRYPWYSGCTNR